MPGSITDVSGIKVGHLTDLEAATGCSVVLCEKGAVAGVDVRGAAPGTRETDLLHPGHLVQEVHAVVLAGGSAFGLAAASGVMRYLEERRIGFDTGVAKVPIVPAAIIFDLAIGDARVRPDAEMGYQAALAAKEGEVAEGNVGAGTGATVGKLLGPRYAMKGGLGTAGLKISNGVTVGALAVVNAVGDVIDPRTGEILAGTRKPLAGGFLDTAQAIKGALPQTALSFTSTTLGVIATDAALTKEQVNRLAEMAYAGLARVIRPLTMLDGDVIFALSYGKKRADLSALGQAAAEVLAEAIVRGVTQAQSLHSIPAHGDLR